MRMTDNLQYSSSSCTDRVEFIRAERTDAVRSRVCDDADGSMMTDVIGAGTGLIYSQDTRHANISDA